ncbi:paraquat-inducible membrane protein A [Saccharibacter sp. 17.LH.SD]|uniref:paraquat-inducible protein A n=1 Tax=Saccharibacter sp. 17.LH.SD TaxID=2689393 RepID=UPI001371E492|nr:paraquat-inducible protein A [Saccharibacter sp. 17.LH.SD]MXV43629.1 paraquat-inducible membrane protein A [Saccharibacter sp. 17.LH.SD]
MLRKDHFHTGLWSQGGAFSIGRRRHTPQPPLQVVEGDVHECKTCGLFQFIPPLKPGMAADCARCGGMLERRRRTSALLGPLCFCITSIALYLALLVSALLTLDVYGRRNTVSLMSGPIELAHQGFGEVGILVGIATLLMPGVVLGLMFAIICGSLRHHMPIWVRPCLTWYERLRPWSMIEVYVIGLLVAYSKLIDLAIVTLQPGAFLLGGLMLMMAAMDSTFDADFVWQHQSVHRRHGLDIYDCRHHQLPSPRHMLSCHACHMVFVSETLVEDEHDMGDCPRCGQILRRRKRKSVSSTLAFLIAALSFYIPANLYPVMTYIRVGQGSASTIISGVIELWQANLYFLSLLVLFASITIPVLKILSLFVMIYCQYYPKVRALRGLATAYRAVVFIGRWSMIDVFMISILVAVVRFGFMARITANPGVVCFSLVVILTIFAADLYDPRRMWDAAGLNDTIANAFPAHKKNKKSLPKPDEREPEHA